MRNLATERNFVPLFFSLGELAKMPIRNGISGGEREGRAVVTGNRSPVQAMMLGSSDGGLMCRAGGMEIGLLALRGSESLCVNSPLETKCHWAIGYADEVRSMCQLVGFAGKIST